MASWPIELVPVNQWPGSSLHGALMPQTITPIFLPGFQPWNCWRLCCWEIDVGPPFFTLFQPEMLTNGARTGWSDQPINMLLSMLLIWNFATPIALPIFRSLVCLVDVGRPHWLKWKKMHCPEGKGFVVSMWTHPHGRWKYSEQFYDMIMSIFVTLDSENSNVDPIKIQLEIGLNQPSTCWGLVFNRAA